MEKIDYVEVKYLESTNNKGRRLKYTYHNMSRTIPRDYEIDVYKQILEDIRNIFSIKPIKEYIDLNKDTNLVLIKGE